MSTMIYALRVSPLCKQHPYWHAGAFLCESSPGIDGQATFGPSFYSYVIADHACYATFYGSVEAALREANERGLIDCCRFDVVEFSARGTIKKEGM